MKFVLGVTVKNFFPGDTRLSAKVAFVLVLTNSPAMKEEESLFNSFIHSFIQDPKKAKIFNEEAHWADEGWDLHDDLGILLLVPLVLEFHWGFHYDHLIDSCLDLSGWNGCFSGEGMLPLQLRAQHKTQEAQFQDPPRHNWPGRSHTVHFHHSPGGKVNGLKEEGRKKEWMKEMDERKKRKMKEGIPSTNYLGESSRQ